MCAASLRHCHSTSASSMSTCYPFEPLNGALFPRADKDSQISLSELSELLNDSQLQGKGLSALGVQLESGGSAISINFVERGKAYADPQGDRTKTEAEESELSLKKTFSLPRTAQLPLPLTVKLSGWNQEGVNFLGRVEVSGGYVLPLTGRGTAALEGQSGDAHAGFCTGGACAAFQERVSLILAAALAAGIRPSDLRQLGEAFFPINSRFHGRDAILHYTLHCALLHSASAGTYREFFSAGGYPVNDVMKPLLAHGQTPGAAFFDKLSQKFSPEELSAANPMPASAKALANAQTVEGDLYPVMPLPGAALMLADGRSMPLSQMAAHLNDPHLQAEAIQMLGFTAVPGQSSIVLEFTEQGKAYAEPHGDRTKLEPEESEQNFSKRLALVEPLTSVKPSIPVTVRVGGWLQEQVNFLGCVTVSVSERETFKIPLTGRGTAALEGRSGDAHAGFCTGGACAAFQNRAALCLGIARAFGVHEDHMESLVEKLHDINSCYHGRGDILDYTLRCAIQPNPGNYVAFMKARYPSHIGRPPVLSALLSTGKPNGGYFDKLAQKFSTQELEEERKRQRAVNQRATVNVTPAKEIKTSEVKLKVDHEMSPGLKKFSMAAIGVGACVGVAIVILIFVLRR